jgi:nucleotide-binding universal stress UspA family protein
MGRLSRVVLAEVGQDLTQKIQKGYEEEARWTRQAVTDVANKFGVSVESRVLRGIPSEDIIRVAQDLATDLVIMGTHGRAGVSHLLLGSVAEGVVRKAPCPVLTVRKEGHDFVTP